MRANALAKSYIQKDSYSFWKDIKHIDNAKIPLASKINDCVGDNDICKMWQDHYQSLLNSVKSLEHKTSVTNTLSSMENEAILDIVNALKSVNKGKACGVDGLAAEHFIYADERIHVILSILFNCFISHGYLPFEFMKTAIVPIIKNKTGDTSDINNYRPIAIVTACSKIFDHMHSCIPDLTVAHTIRELALCRDDNSTFLLTSVEMSQIIGYLCTIKVLKTIS